MAPRPLCATPRAVPQQRASRAPAAPPMPQAPDATQLHISMAGVNISLSLPATSAARVAHELRGYLTHHGWFHLDVIAERENRKRTATGEGRATEVQLAAPCLWRQHEHLYIAAQDAFLLTLNLKCGRGWLRYRELAPQGATRPAQRTTPACLQSALKSLWSVLLPLAQPAFLFHAAAIKCGGCAAVFAGPSGAGKSTLAAMFGAPATLNDELVAISAAPPAAVHLARTLAHPPARGGQEAPFVHSTAFFGSGTGWRRNRCAPLTCGFFLRHADAAHPPATRRLPAAAVLPRLLRCAVLPKGDQSLETSVFGTAATLAQRLPWYELVFGLNAANTLKQVHSVWTKP